MYGDDALLYLCEWAMVQFMSLSKYFIASISPGSDAELFMSRTQCKLGKSFV